ncbi:MAG: HNH endonuclease [Selenomonadaceae bacterium]|nr:HNH endonuclease [Selenomonadaceae bacterium]
MGNYRQKYFEETKSDHGWYTCRRCGGKFRKKDMDVDHIIPQHYGGSDSIYNLQGLCKHCNRSKQDSVKDTLPDLVGSNAERTKKKVDAKIEAQKKQVKAKVEEHKEKAKTKVIEVVSRTTIGKLIVKTKK